MISSRFSVFCLGSLLALSAAACAAPDRAGSAVDAVVACPDEGPKGGKLLPSDGAANELFGSSVALTRNTALIGAQFGEVAYAYRRTGDGWIEDAILTAGDGSIGNAFGSSVAIAGDTAVVGAPGSSDLGQESGAVHVFERVEGTWTETAKLLPSDGQPSDQFGWSVSVSQGFIVVGALGNDEAGTDAGAAYVFERSGGVWTEVAKLLPNDPAPGDQFGRSVSVSGRLVLVGAPFHDDVALDAGAAYVFRRSGGAWTQEAKLLSNDAWIFHLFGFSVSLSGGTAAVGAFGTNSAYVFTRDETGWDQEAKLTAPDTVSGDSFGFSVSIAQNTVVVGAPGHDEVAVDAGSAYVFRRNKLGWSLQRELLPSDGEAGDGFGISVATTKSRALVGSWLDDDQGTDSGSAYVFQLP